MLKHNLQIFFVFRVSPKGFRRPAEGCRAAATLGHNSKAIHRAYAKKAQVVIPTLEDYEKKAAASAAVIVPLPLAAA